MESWRHGGPAQVRHCCVTLMWNHNVHQGVRQQCSGVCVLHKSGAIAAGHRKHAHMALSLLTLFAQSARTPAPPTSSSCCQPASSCMSPVSVRWLLFARQAAPAMCFLARYAACRMRLGDKTPRILQPN